MITSLALISGLMLLFLLDCLNVKTCMNAEVKTPSYRKSFLVELFLQYMYTLSVFYLGYSLAGVK